MKKKTLIRVEEELARQGTKWGNNKHAPVLWLAILMEEVGEAAKAVVEYDLDSYRDEMIQVAAVAISAIDCLEKGK